MTTSTLDARTALLVIDLQKGMVALPVAHPAEEIVKNARALVDAFRRHALPIVCVNVIGIAPGRAEGGPHIEGLPKGWAELLPELGFRPEDIHISKKTWGAFTNTGLEQHLKALAVTQVVIVGIATSIGVESTARFAHELGFNVTLAIDAMTDLNPQAHANSIEWIFPRLGELGTTEEIVALLDSRTV